MIYIVYLYIICLFVIFHLLLDMMKIKIYTKF